MDIVVVTMDGMDMIALIHIQPAWHISMENVITLAEATAMAQMPVIVALVEHIHI